MYVLRTATDDGVARMSIAIDDEDHQFTVWTEDDTALVEYEETLTYRGEIEVSDPRESVYKALLTSEEMTDFLEEHDCSTVKRARTR